MGKSVQKRHPFNYLQLVLQQCKDTSYEELRPESEIHKLLIKNIKFKTDNPQKNWATLELIYENEDSFVYKVMRKEDSKIFILKLGSENVGDLDQERIRGESALLSALNSEYLVNLVEIYEF